jgi:hypothetical protein
MSHRAPGRKARRTILWAGDAPGGNYTEQVLALGEQIADTLGVEAVNCHRMTVGGAARRDPAAAGTRPLAAPG